jgi:phospholipid/cholesterol/gamma-HCH transport system ATP-binding protein
MVSVKDARLSFGSHEVLKGVSFEVSAGEILVIMGSSGAGKTSLLKCIAGLQEPDGGEFIIDDINVADEPDEAHRHLGFVFQYAALFDFLNVRENILFGVRRKKGHKREERDKLVADRLIEVGLEGTAQLLPSELSGGMRKRVGLARALAIEPAVILYDEPTSGLDPVTAYSIDQLIVKTRDRRGVTSLVVSHDVTSILRVADRIIFLHKGEAVFLGTPEEFQKTDNEPIRDLLSKAQADSLD